MNKNNLDGSSSRPVVAVTRLMAEPPRGFAETADLVEHTNLVRGVSPRHSPKMLEAVWRLS